MKQVMKYVSNDGVDFDSEYECRLHERCEQIRSKFLETNPAHSTEGEYLHKVGLYGLIKWMIGEGLIQPDSSNSKPTPTVLTEEQFQAFLRGFDQADQELSRDSKTTPPEQ